MIHALTAEERQILASLELISHGATVAYNPSGGHSGEPDDRMVATVASHVDTPPHVYWRREMQSTADSLKRDRMLKQAREEHQAIVKRQAPAHSEDEGEILRQQIIAAKGWPVVDVARRLSCTPTKVRLIRAENDCDTETGHKRQYPIPSNVVGLHQKVAWLKQTHNLTQDVIARQLGVSQATVSKAFKFIRAAKGARTETTTTPDEPGP